MKSSEPRLMPIGDFARRSRLSVKALRLYDQLGLFAPAHTDPDSGYRYYRTDQLREARLIRAMRGIALPLAAVRRVLAESPETAEGVLCDHLRTVEAQAARARYVVPALISALRKEEIAMSHEVLVRHVPAQPVVSVSRRLTVGALDSYIRESVRTLQGAVRTGGGTVAGAPLGLYHGPINETDNGPIEVCLPVASAITPTGDVAAKELPGGRLAYVTLHGDECAFPAILKGYDAVHDWIERNGYTPVDAPRETWLSTPGETVSEMEVAWRFRDPAGA